MCVCVPSADWVEQVFYTQNKMYFIDHLSKMFLPLRSRHTNPFTHIIMKFQDKKVSPS